MTATAGRLSDGPARPAPRFVRKMKSFRQMLRALVANETDEEREHCEQLRRELEQGGLWGDLWNLAAVFAVFLLVLMVVSAFSLLLFAVEF